MRTGPRPPRGRLIIDRPDLRPGQPSGNSGELSGQGILDNSPTPYGLHHDDPLMEGDVCWLAVKVDDPGNEYTFAAAHSVGHPGKQFLIDRECLQSLSLFRERG